MATIVDKVALNQYYVILLCARSAQEFEKTPIIVVFTVAPS